MNGERLTLEEAEVLVHHYFPKCLMCKADGGYDFSEIGGINYITIAQCLDCKAKWVVWKDRMELKEASIDGRGSDLIGQSYPFPEAEAVLKGKIRIGIRKPSKTEEEIQTYERTIERLTILFSKGEMSEESYTKAIKTIEEKLNKLQKKTTTQCPQCGREVPELLKLCPHCGFDWRPKSTQPPHPSYAPYIRKPTDLWYLVPLLFGLLGGILAYIAVKDEDKGMAESLLVFGVIMFFIDMLVISAIYSYYISMLSRL